MYVSRKDKIKGEVLINIFLEELKGRYRTEIIKDKSFLYQNTFILNLDENFTQYEIIEKVAFLNLTPNQIFKNKNNTYSVVFITEKIKDIKEAKMFFESIVLIYGKDRVLDKNNSFKKIDGVRVLNNNIEDKSLILKIAINKCKVF